MAEHPRIEQLRRRVQQDPASIAFAQLGEEYRRAGDHEEAARVCRTGLDLHPGYLSARVTLGRSLIELGRFDEAQAELEHVLRAAPDNLAASRALTEIRQQRDGRPAVVPPQQPATPTRDFKSAFRSSDEQFAQALETLDASPLDLRLPPLSEKQIEPALGSPHPPDGARASAGPARPTEPPPLAQHGGAVFGRLAAPDPALPALESWLKAILTARESRR